MGPIRSVLGLLAVAAAFCATRNLPMGDADRGAELFRAKDCLQCHGINGEGGSIAPDLGRTVGRSFGPSSLAGLLWNHGPRMWAVMRERGIKRPDWSEQDAADLFAYFFAARYFERPGDIRRGKRVFESKGCSGCHGLASPLRPDAKPVAAWASLEDPIALAQQMWNHAAQMRAALNRAGIRYPMLSLQDATDLLAYLRNAAGVKGSPGRFSPASADTGAMLFVSKGCAACHKGRLALEARPTRYTLTDFAALMWRHAFRTEHDPPPMTYEEMRHLVGYLVSMQFFEERGDLAAGKQVYARKRCGACHDNPASGAPPRAALAGRVTSFGMAAAAWKHGPAVEARLRKLNIPWPRFSGSEMADLTAFVHGLQFKPRIRPGPGKLSPDLE